jgi:hypothetical protein
MLSARFKPGDKIKLISVDPKYDGQIGYVIRRGPMYVHVVLDDLPPPSGQAFWCFDENELDHADGLVLKLNL